jgi:hypothetical protein
MNIFLKNVLFESGRVDRMTLVENQVLYSPEAGRIVLQYRDDRYLQVSIDGEDVLFPKLKGLERADDVYVHRLPSGRWVVIRIYVNANIQRQVQDGRIVDDIV